MTAPPTKPAPGAPAKRTPVDWTDVRARIERAAAATHAAERGPETDRAILQRRARAIAGAPDRAADAEDRLHVIVFKLGAQLLALEAARVRETVAARELTPLPGLPATVAGLANRRSRIVPVFDLRPLLQLPARPADEAQRLVIAECEATEFGLLVDDVAGARELPRAAFRDEVPALNRQFLQGVAEGGLALVDLPAVFAALVVDEAPKP